MTVDYMTLHPVESLIGAAGSDVLASLEQINKAQGAWHAATALVNVLILVLIRKQASQRTSIHVAWTSMLICSPQGLHSLTHSSITLSEHPKNIIRIAYIKSIKRMALGKHELVSLLEFFLLGDMHFRYGR